MGFSYYLSVLGCLRGTAILNNIRGGDWTVDSAKTMPISLVQTNILHQSRTMLRMRQGGVVWE